MTVLTLHWIQDASKQPFGYVRLAGVIFALVLTPLCLAHMIINSPTVLYAEGGAIERLSAILWIGALLLCLLAFFRWHDRFDRRIFTWLCLICILAVARELDAQILLNPKHFGQYGVHYRTDWFFSNEFKVSILLKLIWGTIFIIVLSLIFAPLFILRRSIIRLIHNGDTAVGLFILGITTLAIGFIMDDTLRGTHFISQNLRMAIEETSEMLGAVFYFTGTLCLFWNSPSQRIGIYAEHN